MTMCRTLLPLLLAGGLGVWAFAQQPQAAKPAAPAVHANDKEEGDDETVIKLADAPEAVRAATGKVTPADKVTKVIKETDEGVTTYEVEYTDANGEASARFSDAGDVIELEHRVKVAPAAVLAAITKAHPKATIGDVTAVQTFSYEVAVTIDGTTHEVKVDAAGEIDDEDHERGGEKDEPHGK